MEKVNRISLGGTTFGIESYLSGFAPQPGCLVAEVGSNISFTVANVVIGADLSYQWQLSTNGGSTWNNSTASGAKTATVSTTATAGRNGYQYRCKITYSDGSTNTTIASNPCKLVVLY